MHWLARVAPVLALVAGTGCFATRSDLMVVQHDLSVTRSELLAADTARRLQLDRVIATMTTVQDTVRSMNQRFTRFQGEVRTDMKEYGEQLIRVQELLGVGQQQLQRLRAELESRAQPPATPVPAAGGAMPPTGAPSAAPGAGTPGPNQLFEIGRDQIQRGSPAAGRQALTDLLRLYPEHDLAPDALFYLAEAYAAERNDAAADSTWTQVYTKYPRSERAAEALYRHGLYLENSGRRREAKAIYERVVKEYSSKGAAQLARERLQTLP
ncbi:MAG: tetratricopeptide repeat protein [Gemmatimonadaceae bacterium]